MIYPAVGPRPAPAVPGAYSPPVAAMAEVPSSEEALDPFFEDRLQQAVAQAERTGETVVVHVLTLPMPDRNRLFSLANRISALTRDCDAAAYLGEGRFALVQRAISSFDGALALARKLLEAAGPSSGQDPCLGATIGLSIHGPGISPRLLLERAKKASLQARAQGRTLLCFDHTADTRLPVILLRERLLGALDRKEFFLAFQPQIDLSTGRTLAFEALARWRDPDRGIVGPDSFIALAEQNGLIVELGEWVLEEACRQCVRWNASSEDRVPVAVNVSAVQLQEPGFADRLVGVLERTGLRPDLLELELTETVAITETAVAALLRLQKLGIRLAVDDFGTGYCTFRTLNLLPFDKVKIPAQFVQAPSSKLSSIVDAIASVGHRLGLEIVAEGVETAEQLQAIRSALCHAGQGFLLAPPTTRPRLVIPA